MNATQEEWRPVVGWEGLYEVSNHGRVRSLDRTIIRRNSDKPELRRGRMMKQVPRYARGRGLLALTVGLSADSSVKTRSVHHLVLEAFVGARPPGLVACHWDGDPTNNHVSNLRWDTQAANVADTIRHGRHPAQSQTKCLRGHDLSRAYVTKQGTRQCRECRNFIRRERRLAAGLPVRMAG